MTKINFKKKYMPCVLLRNAKIFDMLPIKKHLPSIRDISGATFYDEYMLDHGLRTPNEAFFHKLWGNGVNFGRTIGTYFGTVSPFAHVFHYSTIISTKN